MMVFHSDLDNTLIYSYKRNIGHEKRCVEICQERELSFMTEASHSMLRQLNRKLLLVPTTTRTVEQYQRIKWCMEPPRYALVCNGGILLEHGAVQETWYQQSLQMIRESREELIKGIKYLENDCNRSFEVRCIGDLFVFTKSRQPAETAAGLKRFLKPGVTGVYTNGEKVYLLPRELSKGRAVMRFQEYLLSEQIAAAGDSEFDISMLCAADIAYAPQELAERIQMQHGKLKVHETEGAFSDFILRSLKKELNL